MSFDPTSIVRDYGDPFTEALACRRSAALFDFSFVARGRISGPGALDALAKLTPRRLDDLAPGQIRYAVRLDGRGHLQADLTVWRHPDGAFEVMSGRQRDIADLVDLSPPGAAADLTADTAIFAVQGPLSLTVLGDAGFDRAALERLAYYQFCAVSFEGDACLAGRLGYTGEAGFEIVAPRSAAARLWQRLAGLARPAGFAAADILRIEAGFVLFAQEFRIPVTPEEAGLAVFGTAAEAPDGPDTLSLIAFTAEAADRPVLWQPRQRLTRPITAGEIAVTSACWSPHAGGVLGLGFARRADLDAGLPLHDPASDFTHIIRAARPFVDPAKRRPRAPWPPRAADG